MISFKKFNLGLIFKSSEDSSLYLLNKLPTKEPTTTPVVVVCPYAKSSEPVTFLTKGCAIAGATVQYIPSSNQPIIIAAVL